MLSKMTCSFASILLLLCTVWASTTHARAVNRWEILADPELFYRHIPKQLYKQGLTTQMNAAPGICGQDPGYSCNNKCLETVKWFKTESVVSNWRHRHKELIRHFHDKCTSMIEIGTARGELAAASLEHVPTLEQWHAVDPFLGGYDKNDVMSTILRSHGNDTNPWVQALIATLPFGCRFQLHHGPSSEVADRFKPRSVDCIFIDGDHTYQGVRSDIQLYVPFVKPGGYIFFDDYSTDFKGVMRALQELVIANNLTMHSASSFNNFYVQKSETSVHSDPASRGSSTPSKSSSVDAAASNGELNTQWAMPLDEQAPYVPIRPMVYRQRLPYPQNYKESIPYPEYFGSIQTYTAKRLEFIETRSATDTKGNNAGEKTLKCPIGAILNRRENRCERERKHGMLTSGK